MRNLFKTLLCALMVALSISANASESQFKLKKVLKAAGKELEREWNAASSESTSASTSSTTTRRRDDGRLKVTSEVEGIVVKVKSCVADDNDNVIIIFSLENLKDNEFINRFWADYSKVYDDEGNLYEKSKSIVFAPYNEAFGLNDMINLPSEIPMKFKMKISDVDPAASVLKMVKINIGQYTGDFNNNIYIKNLPITRPGD